MWIFTVNGFFTVIQDRKDPNFVWLRARLREDIERNFPGVTAEEHPGADYLFRVKLPREVVAQRMFELAMENNVTSHFKDVMIRTASKPKHGSRSSMLYGVWNAGAAMQPIPPYSKTPRPEPKPFVGKPGGGTWRPGDRTVSRSQSGLFSEDFPTSRESQGLYGGAGAGYRASDFDWDTRDWGGRSNPDPALPTAKPSTPELSRDELLEVVETGSTAEVIDLLSHYAPDSDEYQTIWSSLTPEEHQLVLDAEEAALRARELQLDEEFGAQARAVEVVDVLPAPANRPGNRRQRRKAKRKNRHNQEHPSRMGMGDRDPERYAQERRDGKHGEEQRNRQAFLDKQAANRVKGSN